jgi:autotransporter-associated beta strand protein
MKTKSLFAGIAVLTFIGQSEIHAQATWTSGTTGGDWATPGDWTVSGGSAPSSNNVTPVALIFDTATANRTYTNTLTNFTASSITVNSGSRDNTVTGNAITLSGGVTVTTGNWQTIGLNIALASGSGSFSQSTGQTTFSGQISGSEAITKTGGGTVIFSGPNNFSGNVAVSAGALSVTNNSGLGTTVGKTTANGGSLQLSNNITVTGETLEVAGNGGGNTTGVLRNVSGNNTWTGSITTIGNDSRMIAAAGTLTISGVISSTNSGNNQVIFRGEGGTIELTRANTYGGVTRVFGTAGNAATVPMLRLSGGDNRLPTGTTIDIGGGGVSGSMEIAGISQEVAGLVSNNGATASKISGVGAATLVVNNSANGIYTGTLTDSLSFTKSGAATYTLSGSNTYTGETTIKAGTLKINSSTTIGSSSKITVGDAGSSTAVLDVTTAGFTVGSTQTLAGIGTILATGQTVTASGTISAGNSVGTIRIDGGTLALDGTSTFDFELGTSSDLISLLNLATLNLGSGTLGMSDFTFSDSGGFADGVYTLITGAASFSGTLDTGDLTGSVLGRDGTLSMSGNNLILTVIPEPSVALIGSLGLITLLRRRRVG